MTQFDYSILRGKIVEKYSSQKRFAKALGISERSLSLKLNNEVGFTQREILKCSTLLKEPLERMNCTPKVGQKKQLLEVQFFYD